MSAIDDYLAKLDKPKRDALEHIRLLVKSEVSNTTETISYGMPTIKYKSKNLIHFAAFKDHLSIFPSVAPLDVLGDELEAFRKSKGTLQFTADNPIPDKLIVKIIQLQKARIDNKSK